MDAEAQKAFAALNAKVDAVAKVATAAANASTSDAILFTNYNGGIGIANLPAGTWRGVTSPAQLATLSRIPRYNGLAKLTAAQVKALFGKQV